MSFLTDLATNIRNWANGKFATITHNHDADYEPADPDIQAHLIDTSNPHLVDKADVGLGNVTNDAQIKKLASSTVGNVPTFATTAGDELAGGYGVEASSLLGGTNALVRADVIKAEIDAVTAGMASGLADPVQDLAAIKALNTTNAGDFPDKTMILVEDLGLYRLDRDSSAAGDDSLIIEPTTGTGRWLKMSSVTNDHGLLSGLQGGAVGERFHVSSATNDALGGTNGTPNSGNKFVTASDLKLQRLLANGDFPTEYLHTEPAEWTAFNNTLNA